MAGSCQLAVHKLSTDQHSGGRASDHRRVQLMDFRADLRRFLYPWEARVQALLMIQYEWATTIEFRYSHLRYYQAASVTQLRAEYLP